jgi:hypothetical protein
MKDKKGFIFGVTGIIYLVLFLAILGLLIWTGFKISDTLSYLLSWIKEYWWALLIGIILFWYRDVVKALIKRWFKV